jgi:hypothetical protein
MREPELSSKARRVVKGIVEEIDNTAPGYSLTEALSKATASRRGIIGRLSHEQQAAVASEVRRLLKQPKRGRQVLLSLPPGPTRPKSMKRREGSLSAIYWDDEAPGNLI